MTLLATRVGLLDGPLDGRAVKCYRCGQVFDAIKAGMRVTAPCGDCRDYLRNEEGDETVWSLRRDRQRPGLRLDEQRLGAS